MRRAFTLIEVLVVAGVVSLLVAILLPSLAQARNQGRRAVCLGNLKQLAYATHMYLDQNRDYFWRDLVLTEVDETPAGCRWWFGFERDGPAYMKSNRPLDKKLGSLARYLRSTDDGLQCPSFPYSDGQFFRKFTTRSASYGYNVLLGPRNTDLPARRRTDFRKRLSTVFVFADGIHFDGLHPGFNEGHYIDYVDDPTAPYAYGGYGHFRHNRRAQVLFLDGHAEGQPLRGPAFPTPTPAGPAGNLTDPGGGRSLYGY